MTEEDLEGLPLQFRRMLLELAAGTDARKSELLADLLREPGPKSIERVEAHCLAAFDATAEMLLPAALSDAAPGLINPLYLTLLDAVAKKVRQNRSFILKNAGPIQESEAAKFESELTIRKLSFSAKAKRLKVQMESEAADQGTNSVSEPNLKTAGAKVEGNSIRNESKEDAWPHSSSRTPRHVGAWSDLRDSFLRHAKEHAALAAHWSAMSQTWFLWPLESKRGHRLFMELGGAASRLANLQGGAEGWQLWLTHIKQHDENLGAFYEEDSRHSVTASELKLAAESGKSIDEIRKEQKYNSGDVWIDQREVRSVTDGKIEHVLKASADFCDLVYHLGDPGSQLRAQLIPSTLEPRMGDRGLPAPVQEPFLRTSYAPLLADPDVQNLDSDAIITYRRRLLTEFKTKARKKGIKVSDAMVANAASTGKWNDRTMVIRWKVNDPRCKAPHSRRIEQLLRGDPALIWPSLVKSK